MAVHKKKRKEEKSSKRASPTDAMKLIRKWCIEEDMFGQKVEDKNTLWHFVIRYPKGAPKFLDVAQPLGKKDMIVIGAGTKIPFEHMNKMRSLKRKKRDEMLWDLRFLLGNRPTAFSLNEKDGILEGFSNQMIIFFDGLTKDRFMSAVSEVDKSMLLVIWFLHRRFGPPDKKEYDGMMYG